MNFDVLGIRYEIIMKSNSDYRIYDNHVRKWVTFMIDGKNKSSFLSLDEAFEALERLPSENADIL